jgi:hypothetical protein
MCSLADLSHDRYPIGLATTAKVAGSTVVSSFSRRRTAFCYKGIAAEGTAQL